MIKMIISKSFFGMNMSEKDIEKEITLWGASSIHFTPEGFITAVMEDDEFFEYLKKLRNKVIDTVERIKSDKVNYSTIEDIIVNEDLTKFEIYINGDDKKQRERAAFELYLDASAYKVFSSEWGPENEVSIKYKKSKRKQI